MRHSDLPPGALITSKPWRRLEPRRLYVENQFCSTTISTTEHRRDCPLRAVFGSVDPTAFDSYRHSSSCVNRITNHRWLGGIPKAPNFDSRQPQNYFITVLNCLRPSGTGSTSKLCNNQAEVSPASCSLTIEYCLGSVPRQLNHFAPWVRYNSTQTPRSGTNPNSVARHLSLHRNSGTKPNAFIQSFDGKPVRIAGMNPSPRCKPSSPFQKRTHFAARCTEASVAPKRQNRRNEAKLATSVGRDFRLTNIHAEVVKKLLA